MTSDIPDVNVLLNFIDWMFWADIFLNFFMAYEKEDLRVEHDRKKIVVNYLSGWFLIDFVSVFPFDKLIQAMWENSNNS